MRSDRVRGQYVRYQYDIQSECGRIYEKKNEWNKDESRTVPERIVRIIMDSLPQERTDTSRPHRGSHSRWSEEAVSLFKIPMCRDLVTLCIPNI